MKSADHSAAFIKFILALLWAKPDFVKKAFFLEGVEIDTFAAFDDAAGIVGVMVLDGNLNFLPDFAAGNAVDTRLHVEKLWEKDENRQNNADHQKNDGIEGDITLAHTAINAAKKVLRHQKSSCRAKVYISSA